MERHLAAGHEQQPITVAAVDDHPIVLHGLAGLLSSVPEVQVTHLAPDVDTLLAIEGPRADVVLLDLELGDGTTAPQNIQRLRDSGSALVVFSATAVPETVRAAMRAGACGFVPKTEEVGDLFTAIEAAAAGTGWVSPQLAFLMLTDTADDRPALSNRELTALRLYGAGLPLKSVARRMGVAPETAKQYIERVRIKYRKAGRDADTKVDLYRLAVEDGHLPPGSRNPPGVKPQDGDETP